MQIRKLKKTLAFTLLMGTCFVAGAYASDGITQVQAFLRNDFKLVVDGVENNSIKPLIYNDSSYLPVKTLGDMIGADIVWDSLNKTVYVNKRIYATQPETETSTYEQIELDSVETFDVTYLGRTYPLVTNRVYENSTDIVYYRVKDLQAMGVNTDGLRKVQDKITGDLYVVKQETDAAWKETPVFNYASEIPVFGETDEEKLEVLRDFSLLGPFMPPTDDDDEEERKRNYRRLTNMYYFEAVPGKENEYTMLNYDRKFYRYHITITFEEKTINNVKRKYWYIKSYTSEDLQPEIDVEDRYR